MGYHVLRHILVFECGRFVESLLKKEWVLNSQENLQLWQIAQPLLSGEGPIFFGLGSSLHETIEKQRT